jgi:hypothetical protein
VPWFSPHPELTVYFRDSTADFSDCLILARNESRSISPTHTLDRKAAKLAGFQLL